MTEGRKLKKKYLFMTLLLTALIFGLGAPKAMAATMDFTINPQIPSNQANPGEVFMTYSCRRQEVSKICKLSLKMSKKRQ